MQAPLVTVGDQVRLTKELMGTVRFVGEIKGRKGIYYGIELTEAKGKSNGTVGDVRYFKCKSKRGLFLRHARIQEVIASPNIHRIGIHDTIEVYAGNRKRVAEVRYIGIPPRCKEVYYGIQFRKPVGDNDGEYHGNRYFTTKSKCASFIKASSSNIVRMQTDTETPTSASGSGSGSKQEATADDIKQIQLDIYSAHREEEEEDPAPLFTLTILNNFSLHELTSSISQMSQHVSSVFTLRFEPHADAASSANGYSKSNGHTNGHSNGNGHTRQRSNGTIYKKVAQPLTEEQLKLLRQHSFGFYLMGRFLVVEPLRDGIALEERGLFSQALNVYEALVEQHKQSTEALTYFANCLVHLDRFDEAEECYRRALDRNPFLGDACYFYSRLLEYRDKYEEAKGLCSRVMSYVKKKKGAAPPAHHPIHFGCYARLGLKYASLSLDRYNRSKVNVQQKLDRYIHEKEELQQRDQVPLQRLNELNANIAKLERQLSKKEAAIREKDKQLSASQTELKSLRSQLRARSKDSGESGAKLLSQDIVNADDEKVETQKRQRESEPKASSSSSSSSNNTTKRPPSTDKGVVPDFAPLLNRMDSKRRNFESRRDELLSALLTCENMPALADCSDDAERQSLMRSKLELCAVTCQFSADPEKDKDEAVRIDNKKDLLLEVLQCMSGHKWNSIELLQQCIETVWMNLFRSLPDASMIKTDASDDEMDFRDPSWEHLQLIYELTFHVVTNTHIDKKTMKKHLQGAFLENLIHLFSSCDDREPQYVKIIVHAIYGRFMALRKSIRKHLSDYCYHYVYLSTSGPRDAASWQGLPEILEIFCSIFQGLNVPVKPDYHVVLRNVIVPLHKSFHLDEFHEQLLQCCTQFVTKDPYSAPVILGGMLKFWPKFSPSKEQLFIMEIVHILNVCVRHPNIKQSDPAFATITIAVLKQFISCMVSPHHQVAERSLMVWRDETVRICVDLHREKIWPSIYAALQHNKERYWLSAIRNINRQIMSDFKRRDPEFFEKIEKQQQSQDISEDTDAARKRTKLEQRQERWSRLRKLAQPK